MIIIMREGLFLGLMLNNSESLINITKSDLEILDRPDTMVKRSILKNYGNPSKVLIYL